MAQTQESEETVERDLAAYADKPATPSLEFYSEWLQDATGYDPAAAKSKAEAFERAVYLAVTLHRDFQTSDQNIEFKEKQRVAREEALEQARVEREEAKAAKAAEQAAAATAAAEAKALKDAEKAERAAAKAAVGKTPATQAAAATAKPTAPARPAGRKATAPAPKAAPARPARRTAKGGQAAPF